jgi:hypothetical protein
MLKSLGYDGSYTLQLACYVETFVIVDDRTPEVDADGERV